MAFIDMEKFEHLKIHLEELKNATSNFGSKVIGAGGFGSVYEGEVVHSKGRSMVAIKRLNRKFGQGDPEFWKEIMMLSRYTHKNLISLLGFCAEGGERILVYEHASKGSLDRHLSSKALTWTQRLKICLDAARGLAYLHDHKGTQQRVIHRDIKSANILLDDKWNAKLSDMGLSKLGPANQRHTVIGAGGFGSVYEGEVVHSKGRSMVAIKRLNRKFGQGDPEFWKEIMMLSRYTHKNLISLLGFCAEGGERILVYKHASKGSLNRHLSSKAITWTQRLKICLDAARGLAYLHDHKGTQQRVIHRDIKSANILLDDKWNAKLSDMGLSKIGPANQRHTVIITNVSGTPGYCDPSYMETYNLTKESDIYSFGVVLFEVLCGKLCSRYTNNQLEILVPMWKQSYMHKKLDQVIFKDLWPPMDPTSLQTFSEIAFQCLHYCREQRPTLSILVKRLEIALELQEHHEMNLTNAVVVVAGGDLGIQTR